MSDTSEKRYRPGAAVLVTDGQGRILLCRRAEQTAGVMPETLQTVQGGIEPGETPRQAAIRELKEELGLEDSQFEIVNEAPGIHRYDWPEEFRQSLLYGRPLFAGQEHTYFLARVRPEAVFRLDAHEREFSKVWWGTPQELVNLAWERKRPGIEAALRFFGLL